MARIDKILYDLVSARNPQAAYGLFARVIPSRSDADYVCKYFYDDPGYRLFIDYVRDYPSTHLPTIKAMVLDNDNGYVKMERLGSLPPEYNHLLGEDLINELGGYCARPNVNDDFMGCVRDIENFGLSNNMILDWHSGNIMMRADGTLVIIDPFAAELAESIRPA